MRSKHLPQVLQGLRMPVIAAPMFTVSYPELVKAQCRAGIVGSFPALNARPAELLDEWLTQIQEELKAYQAKYPERKVGPIAVNQIVHVSNTRLERDMQICVKHRIPIYITSLRAPIKEMIDAVHSYGGIVLHDVISLRHAEKALEAGVDGLILVAAGAGGHAGGLSPFALVGEVRKIFTGPIVLSGSISNGSAVLAANAMGADFAYMGTRFIASQEAHATEAYKRAIVEANASDIVYTDYFTGILGNYIKKSIENAGLDPNHLPAGDPGAFAKLSQENKEGGASKAWKDIWGAGQGVGLIDNVPTVAQIVDTLEQEYRDAKKSLLS